MDESDEKEGILKRLRNIESKNKDQLKMTEKKKKQLGIKSVIDIFENCLKKHKIKSSNLMI